MIPRPFTVRITPLASGSQGNSLLVEAGGMRVLIDVGLDPDELEKRLHAIAVEPRSIDAAILTHRHKDHVRGATEFCRRHRVRIFAVRRTSRSVGSECHKLIHRIVPSEWFAIGENIRVLPVPVEHDAPDTVALLVEAGGKRYGHATDLGTPHGPVRELLTQCDALYLEFNYDPELLANGEYPGPLKTRIASDTGHLSNSQSAELLRALRHPGLRHVFVAHVSRNNNTPSLALDAARGALDGTPAIAVLARQDEPTPTADLDSEPVDERAERVGRTGEETVSVSE